MRDKYQGHHRFVGDWIDEAGRGLACEALIDLHQQAVRALWQSARTTVSDVTLDAVLERVVINARDHFPWLPALPIANSSIDVSVLRAQCGAVKAGDVKRALRFIVTEFMAILGNLTAETLTPGLRRELSKVRPQKGSSTSEKNGESEK